MFNQNDIQNLLAIIPIGQNNAITAPIIAQRLGYPTGGIQVKTRRLIDFAIDNGNVILSSSAVAPKGYWVSNNITEVREYIRSLRNRAEEINERADNLRTGWNNNYPNNQI
jgi:hypothetical protein